MENWNEIKTAYHVLKLGTVSAAADYLKINRVTVIRHIDALEEFLGEKLFLRHSKGYSPTEVGKDLYRVAKLMEEQLEQFEGRTKNQPSSLSGELIITSVKVIAPILLDYIHEFQLKYPQIAIRYLPDSKLFKLEHGEAHIAVRTGPKPSKAGYLVQFFTNIQIGMFACKKYSKENGIPQNIDDFSKHYFVGLDHPTERVKFDYWIQKKVPKENIAFRSSSFEILEQAIHAGRGIGFIPTFRADKDSNLVAIMPDKFSWDIPFWILTHQALHHTPKVQAFLKCLEEKKPVQE